MIRTPAQRPDSCSYSSPLSPCPSRIGRMIKRSASDCFARMPFFHTSCQPAMNYLARCCSFHPKPVFRLLAVLAGLTISLAAATGRGPTGGPENVLLVVNPRSPDSLCIANHYAELRHIPPNNFLFLDWDPKQENTDVDTFREKILLPVLRAACKCCRFPAGRSTTWSTPATSPGAFALTRTSRGSRPRWKNRRSRERERKARRQAAGLDDFHAVASINGLTYLWEPVMTNNFYVHPQSNWYARTGAAGTGQGTDLGVLQRHGLRSPWRGGNRSGTPLLVVDDAGRDVRPRQYAG